MPALSRIETTSPDGCLQAPPLLKLNCSPDSHTARLISQAGVLVAEWQSLVRREEPAKKINLCMDGMQQTRDVSSNPGLSAVMGAFKEPCAFVGPGWGC